MVVTRIKLVMVTKTLMTVVMMVVTVAVLMWCGKVTDNM